MLEGSGRFAADLKVVFIVVLIMIGAASPENEEIKAACDGALNKTGGVNGPSQILNTTCTCLIITQPTIDFREAEPKRDDQTK